MRVYGNAKSDGFPLFSSLLGATFVAVGLGLVYVGGVAVVGGALATVAATALLVRGVRRWDVTSEAPTPTVQKIVPRDDAKVRFPVAAQTDAAPVAPRRTWGTLEVAGTPALPSVDKPKPAVETNTHVQ
jgi:hypothetical protein